MEPIEPDPMDSGVVDADENSSDFVLHLSNTDADTDSSCKGSSSVVSNNDNNNVKTNNNNNNVNTHNNDNVNTHTNVCVTLSSLVKKRPGTGMIKCKDELRRMINNSDLEAEKILGCLKVGSELVFLVKWKNVEWTDLIFAKLANHMFPDVVIRFYEERFSLGV